MKQLLGQDSRAEARVCGKLQGRVRIVISVHTEFLSIASQVVRCVPPTRLAFLGVPPAPGKVFCANDRSRERRSRTMRKKHPHARCFHCTGFNAENVLGHSNQVNLPESLRRTLIGARYDEMGILDSLKFLDKSRCSLCTSSFESRAEY